MICILKMQGGEITGWIIANDIPDARRYAEAALQGDLAGQLYRMEFTPTQGKHELPGGYVMLVQ